MPFYRSGYVRASKVLQSTPQQERYKQLYLEHLAGPTAPVTSTSPHPTTAASSCVTSTAAASPAAAATAAAAASPASTPSTPDSDIYSPTSEPLSAPSSPLSPARSIPVEAICSCKCATVEEYAERHPEVTWWFESTYLLPDWIGHSREVDQWEEQLDQKEESLESPLLFGESSTKWTEAAFAILIRLHKVFQQCDLLNHQLDENGDIPRRKLDRVWKALRQEVGVVSFREFLFSRRGTDLISYSLNRDPECKGLDQEVWEYRLDCDYRLAPIFVVLHRLSIQPYPIIRRLLRLYNQRRHARTLLEQSEPGKTLEPVTRDVSIETRVKAVQYGQRQYWSQFFHAPESVTPPSPPTAGTEAAAAAAPATRKRRKEAVTAYQKEYWRTCQHFLESSRKEGPASATATATATAAAPAPAPATSYQEEYWLTCQRWLESIRKEVPELYNPYYL